MGSHVCPKGISSCAREVALCANKGLLSAVNSHMGFQVGRCVAGVAALNAIVTFLCISVNFIHFHLAGHFEIFLFWRVLYVTMLWDDWQRKSNFEGIVYKKRKWYNYICSYLQGIKISLRKDLNRL